MIVKENLRKSYVFYKEYADQPVELKLYLELVSLFIKFVVTKVLEGFRVELSGGNSLGVLYIEGQHQNVRIGQDGEIKGLSVDWKKTKEHWESSDEAKEKRQKVYNFNEHTNGIIYRFVWDKFNMKLVNKGFYNLCINKTNRRLLAKYVNEGKEYHVKLLK